MSSLARASKNFGFAATATLHLGLLLTCLAAVLPSAAPLTLPPPLEAMRITLAEPAARARPKDARATAQPAPSVPEQSVALVPEPPAPPVADARTPKVARPEPKPAVQPKSAPSQPRAKPLQEVAPQEAPLLLPQVEQESLTGARQAAEAEQTLLSALVAALEREKRYPTAVRRLGIEGQVLAVLRLDEHGAIISVSAKSGQAILEQATLEALQRVKDKWRPLPVPAAMSLSIPLRYSLNSP